MWGGTAASEADAGASTSKGEGKKGGGRLGAGAGRAAPAAAKAKPSPQPQGGGASTADGGESFTRRRNSTTSTSVDLLSSQALEGAAVAEMKAAEKMEERARGVVDEAFEARLGRTLQVHAANQSSNYVDGIMREWDTNKDGELSKVEFRQAVRNKLGLKAQNNEIDAVFDAFDDDASGGIDLRELKPFLKALSGAAVAADKKAASVRELAEMSRSRFIHLTQASELMRRVEKADAWLAEQRAAHDVRIRFMQGVGGKGSVMLEEIVRDWKGGRGGGSGAGLSANKEAFRSGVLAVFKGATADEIDQWFQEDLEEVMSRASTSASSEGKLAASGKLDVLKALQRAREFRAEWHRQEGDLLKSLEAMRKEAHAQQNEIRQEAARTATEAREKEIALKEAVQAQREAEAAAAEAKEAARAVRAKRKEAEKAAFAEKVEGRRRRASGCDSTMGMALLRLQNDIPSVPATPPTQ